MDAITYIKQRQSLWARRRGIQLQARNGSGDGRYCRGLAENLLVQLSDATKTEYQQGDGRELAGNMRAVFSSSALAVNLFEYWRQKNKPKAVAQACQVPSSRVRGIRFEVKLPIAEYVDRALFPNDPNLDAVFDYASGNVLKLTGIEVKFSEPYFRGRASGRGIRRPYLENGYPWFGDVPHLKELARSICPDDNSCRCLHLAQLIKHVLGLKHACGKRGFRLLYLWYDVPFDEGHRHRQEIATFARTAKADGIQFQALTVQELIIRLTNAAPSEHGELLDYLAERYL